MYVRERPREGIPSRLYRHPSEICKDMAIIEEKIRETEEKLSVHNLVDGILEMDCKLINEELISTVDGLICNAERSLFHLERLRSAMIYLEEELSEVRWLLKKDA